MAPKTIVLKGDPIYKEGKANAAIRPGDLVERMSTGNIRQHAGEDQNVSPVLVAVENSLEGEEIGDNYAANDRVQFCAPPPGAEMYMWLKDGESVSIGDELGSGGEGSLVKLDDSASGEPDYTHKHVGSALETVDNSSSGSGDVRIQVEIG